MPSLANTFAEISDAVTVARWPLVAEYLVHWASIEANLYLLYLNFLDSFADTSLEPWSLSWNADHCKGIPASVPLRDIVVSAFDRDPQD